MRLLPSTMRHLRARTRGRRALRRMHCTGIAASWCPIHGDCTCPRAFDGAIDFDAFGGCPLHGYESVHAGEYA